MPTFAEHFAADRRLCILKLLEAAPEFTANEYLLQSALAEHGHSISRAALRTDLAWLAEQGVLTVNDGGALHVAQITERGVDVAHARATVPGIKRPSPGA
jgi:Fe2+ or Zn2+ uptake regulation protein